MLFYLMFVIGNTTAWLVGCVLRHF